MTMTSRPTGRIVPDERRAGEGTRSAVLARGDDRFELWFRTHDGHALDPGFADPYVLASLLFWMRSGGRVHVEGTVSAELLAELDEWQTVWLHWTDGRYERVEFTADRIVEGVRAPRTAIAAFSGGLDSMCTAVRHARGLVRARTLPLGALLMVHGYDIPLGDETDFALAYRRNEQAAERLGVELRSVATNLRELSQTWEECHGLAVAAALHLYAAEFGAGLIASSSTYTLYSHAWGSNPLTDHLLSSDRMRIHHDAAELSRTEKCAVVGEHPELLALLRVCWQGARRDRNCGRCEKCVRTYWNLRIAGAEPSCFDGPVTVPPQAVRMTEHRVRAWRVMYAEARAAGDAEATAYIGRVLRTQRMRIALRRVNGLQALVRRARRRRAAASRSRPVAAER